MTNPPGAMPPMPEPVAHINLNGVIHEVGYDWLPVETLESLHTAEQLQAYAAPLLARVAELQAALEKLTLSKIDRECLRIGQQIHRAAGDLPETYEIEIEIERGSGSVYLCKPDYTKVAFNDHVDGLSESIKDAIDAAIAAKD